MAVQKMTPVAFGAPGKNLSGAYHPAHSEGGSLPRACGVLLCNPFGWEAIASQRSYRVLADRLAAMGFAVLRFDYLGTGDSAGTDRDPAQLRGWLDGIGSAIEELKRLSGVTEVSLLGVQLGGTLAAMAAREHAGASIASLVLWAPFLTGRAFLRQIRAYRMLNDVGTRSGRDDGDEEAAGFVLLKETVEDLGKIDLLAPEPIAVPRALLLQRDGQSPEPKLAERLRRNGAHTEVAFIAGYLPMMQDPRKSVVPEKVLDKVTAWLAENHPARMSQASPAPPSEPSELEAQDVREHAQFFGERSRLFGIVTHATMPPSRPLPIIVWLNTASDHRVGPNRLYVPLARQLAQRGFTSLRFDPSGVGDGEYPETVPEAHAYSRHRIADLKEAMDFLARSNLGDRFVLVGLCSAGFVAFHVALEDRRVVSEILINPQTFVWREGDSLELTVRKSYGSNRYYSRQLLNVAQWKRFVRGKVNFTGIAGVVGARLVKAATRRVRRMMPMNMSRELDIERAFRRKLQLGTDVLVVHAENDGGLDYIELHLGHNARRLRRSPHFRFEVVSGADHTFSQRWAQSLLTTLISDHIVSRFGH